MATYGIDYYGKSFYGAPLLIDYAVTNLAAAQLDFGHVRISWTAPAQNIWTELALIRSRYGFPVSVSDGDLLATYSSTQASTSYDDFNLTPGYWYYGVFASVPLAPWSADLTYQAGDRISYSGANWIATQVSTDVPPAAGAYWSQSNETSLWQPAGAIATMSIADHGYASLMDSYIPGAYKSTPILVTDDQVVNSDLTDFLAILGWGFEVMGTENDDLFHLYDTATTRYDRLLEISRMLGVSAEQASSPRYQRLRTAQAANLGRAKGTETGLAELIEAATGLSCTITTGPNMMLKRDQSDFPWPLYPVWQTDESYSVGDLVSYQGARYQAITWAFAPSATLASPNALGSGTVSGVSYVSELSATGPTGFTYPLTVPTTGVYVLQFTFVKGPANGIVEIVDGNGHTLALTPLANIATLDITASGFNATGTGTVTTVDTYASATAVGTTYVCPMTLTAGTNYTFEFLCPTSKNSSSTGYGIEVGALSFTAKWTQYPPNSTPPTNGAANTGLQWSAPPATAQHGYNNPATGQVATWSLTGSTAASLEISYLGRIGLSMDTNWLSPNNGFFTANGVYSMISAAYPVIPVYNNGSNYLAGQIVIGPDGLQYTALSATSAAPPDPGVWQRTAYSTPYDRELIAQSTTPVHPAVPYDSNASYAEGDQVIYNGCLYNAPAPVKGITPPASAGSNSGWSYVGPAAALAWTASLYNPVPTTGTLPVYPGLEFYDVNGQPIVAAGLMTQAGSLVTSYPILGRMADPVADLSGVFADSGGHSYITIPTGYWQVSSGAANANPNYSGGTSIKLCYLASGVSDCCVGVTFPVGVIQPAVRDVGIVFRLSDATHFLAAFRDQIVEYNGGTKTQLASYTRLPLGTRLFVQAIGSTIRLYSYPGGGAAPVLTKTVTTSFNQTATNHGLIDWTF